MHYKSNDMKAREITILSTCYICGHFLFMSPSFLYSFIIHTDLSGMMKYHHKKMIGQVRLVIISRLLPYVCSNDLDKPLPPAHF